MSMSQEGRVGLHGLALVAWVVMGMVLGWVVPGVDG